MSKIKTKEAIKDTIKTIDKAAILTERMKSAYTKTKNKAEVRTSTQEDSTNEYAADCVEESEEQITQELIYAFDREGRKAFGDTKDNVVKIKDKVQSFHQKETEKVLRKQNTEPTITYNSSNENIRTSSKEQIPIKTATATGKNIKQSKSSASKQTGCCLQKHNTDHTKTYFDLNNNLTSSRDKIPIKTASVKEKTIIESKNPANKQAQSVFKKQRIDYMRSSLSSFKDIPISSGEPLTNKTTPMEEKNVKPFASLGRNRSIKNPEKIRIKTVGKSIKNAEQMDRAFIKTAKAAEQTINTSKKATYATKPMTQAALQRIKSASKAMISVIKGIVASTKALIIAIAASMWVTVTVIVMLCLISLLASSVFGIFFSCVSANGENTMTMQSVVQEINTEYDTKIQEICDSVSYDNYEILGDKAIWKEVIAVYAIKINTDSDNPQEVATMDESKKSLLSNIFWEMNEISYEIETETETVVEETDDGHGKIVEMEKEVTNTILYITVSHKTADEMAENYGFNTEQQEYLTELLRDENSHLWMNVLNDS